MKLELLPISQKRFFVLQTLIILQHRNQLILYTLEEPPGHRSPASFYLAFLLLFVCFFSIFLPSPRVVFVPLKHSLEKPKHLQASIVRTCKSALLKVSAELWPFYTPLMLPQQPSSAAGETPLFGTVMYTLL